MTREEINNLNRRLSQFYQQIDWLMLQDAINCENEVDIKSIILTLRNAYWKEHENLIMKFFRAYGTRNMFAFPYDCYITTDKRKCVRNIYGNYCLLDVLKIDKVAVHTNMPNDFEMYQRDFISDMLPEIVMMRYILQKEEAKLNNL